MKSAKKRPSSRPNSFSEQIVGAPRHRSVESVQSTGVGDIISGNDLIEYDSPREEKLKVRANDHVKELNLLSKGKQLLDCCKTGDTAEVKRLMNEGAPFIADWVGTSPLHYAVMNKHVEVAELLLKHGISKDTKNKVDRTPLHIAAHMGLAYMVKLLLTYGAEVNCKDMLHMTPLHWAAESGDLLSSKILIDYGADIHVVNKFGKTACDMARGNKFMEIVRTITDTEMLPVSTRALKVCDMMAKVRNTPCDMNPVAEILEPSPEEPKLAPDKATKKKKVVVIATHDVDGPTGTIRFGGVIDSSDEISTDSAIKLLKSHGVSVVEPDKDTTVSSAVLNGHTIRLTDAGKLAFQSLEKNLKIDKLPPTRVQELDRGESPENPPKRRRSDFEEDSSDVIIGASLAQCTLDLPSLSSTNSSTDEIAPTLDSIKNPNERARVFLLRLKAKRKQILRHLEIIENQRTIKQKELNLLNNQIRGLENAASMKK